MLRSNETDDVVVPERTLRAPTRVKSTRIADIQISSQTSRNAAAAGPLCLTGEYVMLQIHVVLSLIGILAGFVVLYGLITQRLSGGWNAVFLATTILTSLSGFPLPPFGFDPPRAVGVISLVLLAAAAAAYYAFHLAGAWRVVFVGAAVAALYLNVFVLVAQAFMKVSFLKALAPTQSEPPFIVSQVVVLLAFVALGLWAVLRFRPEIQVRI